MITLEHDREQTTIVRNLTELAQLAEKIGEALNLPTLILLKGELGTGKTAFTKKLLSQFGIAENKVKSPTFSLINLYQAEKYSFAHLDLYRLDRHDPFILEEIKELSADKAKVILIEWPEKMDLSDLTNLFKQIISIEIKFDQNNFRKFDIYVKNQ